MVILHSKLFPQITMQKHDPQAMTTGAFETDVWDKDTFPLVGLDQYDPRIL